MLPIGFGNIPNKNSSFKFWSNLQSMPYTIPRGGSLSNVKVKTIGHTILQKLTTDYLQTLLKCNPKPVNFSFKIPQRDLTKPKEGIFNDGFDNEENDYILRVHDLIINQNKDDEVYKIVDLLGKGTFGQVVKCLRESDNTYHAIKIIKCLPVYNYQAAHEIRILQCVNQREGQIEESQRRVVTLVDQFIFRNHVCLVFPLLHISLFDLLQEYKFQGLPMDLIRSFLRQILEGVKLLHELNITHCDLKPENILLQSKENHSLKIIDLGSVLRDEDVCFEYIQSLFYRAPEVILGMPKTSQIDMWSIGCIAAELYLGQPIFVGTSSFSQLNRILSLVQMQNIQTNKQRKLSDYSYITQGQRWQRFLQYTNSGLRIKTIEEFQLDNQYVQDHINQNYYNFESFADLEGEFDKSLFRTPNQKQHLSSFIDFVKNILVFDPQSRMTPSEALNHPFIKGHQNSSLETFQNDLEEKSQDKFFVNQPTQDNYDQSTYSLGQQKIASTEDYCWSQQSNSSQTRKNHLSESPGAKAEINFLVSIQLDQLQNLTGLNRYNSQYTGENQESTRMRSYHRSYSQQNQEEQSVLQQVNYPNGLEIHQYY